MDLKYYSLDRVTVLSVPGVVLKFRTFLYLQCGDLVRNQKEHKLHSVTETLTDQTDRHTDKRCDRFD